MRYQVVLFVVAIAFLSPEAPASGGGVLVGILQDDRRQLVFGTVERTAEGGYVTLRVDEVVWGHLQPGQVIRYCFIVNPGPTDPPPGRPPDLTLEELKPGTEVFVSLGKYGPLPLPEYEGIDRYGAQVIITSPVQRDQVRERIIREYKIERHARSDDPTNPVDPNKADAVPANGGKAPVPIRPDNVPSEETAGRLWAAACLVLAAVLLVGGSISLAKRRHAHGRR